MTRQEELMRILDGADELTKATLTPLIEDVVFLEKQLDDLRKLPFIRVHPTQPELQKTTPAAKQYKELLQQYINCIKAIEKVTGSENDETESPLRRWVNERVNSRVNKT